jgi:hypothetical protein
MLRIPSDLRSANHKIYLARSSSSGDPGALGIRGRVVQCRPVTVLPLLAAPPVVSAPHAAAAPFSRGTFARDTHTRLQGQSHRHRFMGEDTATGIDSWETRHRRRHRFMGFTCTLHIWCARARHALQLAGL